MKPSPARALFAALLLLPLVGCFRVDRQNLSLRVPGMESVRDLVLVTNAAQHELMGEFPDAKHWCEVDLARSLLVYYEGPRLAHPAYRTRLLSALSEAGYPGSAGPVAHDPLPPLAIGGHRMDEWPDRHRLVIHIPALQGPLDANRVADALAFGRLGGRPDRLRVDPATRTVTVAQQNRRVAAWGNFAHAVTGAGYDVEGWPAAAPGAEHVPRGWVPVGG